MQEDIWDDIVNGNRRPMGIDGRPVALAAHIIDGQQRIATVVLTYAILHHMLHHTFGENLSNENREYLDAISARFTWIHDDERRLLLRTAGELKLHRILEDFYLQSK